MEQRIIQAAKQVFIEKGYAKAGMSDIAARVGINRPGLHYYFRTKEHIFERILDEKMRLMSESVLAAFGQPGLPLPERLRNGIERHFDFIAANPDLPRFIVNEVLARPDRYECMQRSVRRIANVLMLDIQRELDASAARGETEPMDVRMLMLDIISLNAFPFIAYPVIVPLLGDLAADRETFFRLRKQETIEVVMRRLMPRNRRDV